MEVARILAEIDAQIKTLQQARSLLEGNDVAAAPKPTRGRPKKSAVPSPSSTTTLHPSAPTSSKRRTLSPDARKRIADAQKRRWAQRRKDA